MKIRNDSTIAINRLIRAYYAQFNARIFINTVIMGSQTLLKEMDISSNPLSIKEIKIIAKNFMEKTTVLMPSLVNSTGRKNNEIFKKSFM